MKIELDLPDIEGFEIAEGKQPRPVKVGEYYLGMETLEAKQWNGACTSFDNAIVLKKKAPKYKTVSYADCVGDNGCKYVEIKALEDLIKLAQTDIESMSNAQCREWDAIVDLIK